MAFGHETVVPVEIGMGTHHTEHFNEKQNNEQMCLNLHLLAEKKKSLPQGEQQSINEGLLIITIRMCGYDNSRRAIGCLGG